jgi:glycosyltransferase involved in cell wall biosynthesis
MYETREREREESNTLLANQSIKVSIIVPIYNVEQYLRRCLDSLINQTLKEIEIILVNDCSPDNCQSIMEEYAGKDKRVILIKHESNQGVSVARNNGMNIARGEYIGFVDPDDYVDLDFYEKLYRETENNRELDIVKGNVKMTDFDGITRVCDINMGVRENKFYFNWQFWSAIYKRSFIQNNKIDFPPGIITAQDVVFLIKSIILSDNIIVIDNTFYNYIRVENSLASRILSNEKIKSRINAFKLIIDTINSHEISKEDYFFNFINRLNDLKSYFNVILDTDKESKQLIPETLIKFYDMCKYKLDFSLNYKQEEWYEFLIKKDVVGLYNFLNIRKKIIYKIKILGIIFVEMVKTFNADEYKIKIKLFSIIPLLKIDKTKYKTKMNLFSIIPLLKIKSTGDGTKYKYYLFNCIQIMKLRIL